MSASSSSASPGFDSVSVPLTAIVSCKFEQPLFGSNHLILDVKPVAAGGLTEGTKLEVRLKDKGLFEFASSLDKTRERAIYMRRQSVDEEDALRTSFFHVVPFVTLTASSQPRIRHPSVPRLRQPLRLRSPHRGTMLLDIPPDRIMLPISPPEPGACSLADTIAVQDVLSRIIMCHQLL